MDTTKKRRGTQVCKVDPHAECASVACLARSDTHESSLVDLGKGQCRVFQLPAVSRNQKRRQNRQQKDRAPGPQPVRSSSPGTVDGCLSCLRTNDGDRGAIEPSLLVRVLQRLGAWGNAGHVGTPCEECNAHCQRDLDRGSAAMPTRTPTWRNFTSTTADRATGCPTVPSGTRTTVWTQSTSAKLQWRSRTTMQLRVKH